MVKSGGRAVSSMSTRCQARWVNRCVGNSGLLSQDVQVELFQPRIPDVDF